MPRARAALAATLLCCAIALLAAKLGDWASAGEGWLGRPGDFHVSSGEALVHGIKTWDVAFCMPGFSVPNALLCQHAGDYAQLLARGLSLLADAVLVFALGWLLHSALCGGLAALLFAFIIPPYLSSDRWLYALQVLAVAVALVWRARAPSPRRDVALAVCIGMSLLIMSPLFLFLPALLTYEWLRDRRGGAPRSGRRAALLCLIPFLFLTLWSLMNWRLQHRLILFEDGRARSNIITGALGFVSTCTSIPDAGLDFRNGSPLLWAAQTIWHHPGRYLSACGQRLVYAASFHLWLYLAALAAALLLRRREAHRQLILLIIYFLGIHCLMTVEMKYFEPLLPLLCALAAALALAWLRPAASRASENFAAAALGAILAPILLVQLYALGLTVTYPSRSAPEAAYDRELRKYPRDAWLWSWRGKNRLEDGDPRGAAADLAKALSIVPRLAEPRSELQQRYSWARMVQGGRGSGYWALFPASGSLATMQYAFRSIYLLRQGRRDEARAALNLMDDLRMRKPVFNEASDDARLKPWREAAGADDYAPFADALSCWPSPEHPALRNRLARLRAETPRGAGAVSGLWIQEAAGARRSGQNEAAHEALDRAGSAPLDHRQSRRVAELYRDLGEYRRAFRLLEQPAQRNSKNLPLLLDLVRRAQRAGQQDAVEMLAFAARLPLSAAQARAVADLLLDLGDSALNSGWPEVARAALVTVARLRPDGARLCRMVGIYAGIGAASAAFSTFQRAQATTQCPSGPLLKLTGAAGDSGRRAEALAALDTACGRKLDERQLRDASALYGALREPERAKALLRRLLKPAGPQGVRDPSLLLDLADAAAAGGDAGLALHCLAQARRFGPLPEELGRAAITYQNLGEYGAALETLDRLCREQPRQARWRSDRGIIMMLLGRREEAVRDWQQAIALDAGFLPPYLSLGSYYASSGRRQEALRLYAQAWAQSPPSDPGLRGIRDRIRSEREKLR